MPSIGLRPRLRMLRTLNDWPHRYRRIRVLTMGLTLAVLYAIPLSGMARLDLWDGRHRLFGAPTNEVYGLGAVMLGILAFYFVTFVINAFLGRLFCGFGCPIGQASRFGDDIELASKRGSGKLGAHAQALGFALLLGSSIFLWFVSPAVFLEGAPRAIGWALGGLGALVGVIYLHGRYFRWGFCKNYCPIGVYYSAVQTNHGFGIHFDAEAGTCKECDVCSAACPVDLHPRDLDRPREGMGGIAIDGFPERHHCLSCGDCVRACESVFRVKPDVLIPLRMGRAKRSDGPARAA